MAYVYQWYATVNLGTIRFTASSLLRCCKIWNQERIRMINNLMYIELKMGYSDDDIDTIFDGDPSAYWNID